MKDTSFFSCIHLIPRHPSLVGRVTISQLIWCLLCLDGPPDQRKFLINASKWFDTDFRKRNNWGNVSRQTTNTCLTMVLRPAMERSLDFQPKSLRRNLSSKAVKCCLLGVQMMRGAPRCQPYC